MRHLASRIPTSEQERLERPYYDYLQAPLQPLADDLESQTYETFEKDPVKYKQYQEATRRALVERHPPDGPEPVLMVVGAGRGPLVAAALAAAREAGRSVRVFALDKNQNAVVTLRNRCRNEAEWAERVTVVSGDMREWRPPVLADILISELLGSWGDNELSPECLDGAQRYLKPGGISIPVDYTSYVAPLSSSKLWNEVKQWKELAKFETPFVVAVHNAYQMAPSKVAFYFSHPTPDPGPHGPPAPDNSRYVSVSWDVPLGATLHGFVGYFHSTLYADVCISTDPATLSVGMFSWFPLYMPLRHPVRVADGTREQQGAPNSAPERPRPPDGVAEPPARPTSALPSPRPARACLPHARAPEPWRPAPSLRLSRRRGRSTLLAPDVAKEGVVRVGAPLSAGLAHPQPQRALLPHRTLMRAPSEPCPVML